MNSGFLRHFLYFTPVFAIISVVIDFIFGRNWPPEFLEVGVSAVIAGGFYAALMTLWVGSKKDEGEKDDEGN